MELQTIFLEIEAIINSRPLCELYDEDFSEPLTSNHLLWGRKFHQTNIGKDDDKKLNVEIGRKRAKYIDLMINSFWKRWRKEYVNSIRSWKQKKERTFELVPEVNDIVLIFEEKVPRKNWSLGKIVEILPSKDKKVRGARILVGKNRSIIERPINKLYPIELQRNDENIHSNESKVKRNAAILAASKIRIS